MGIHIDSVSVFCDAKCCNNKLEVAMTDGRLEDYCSGNISAIEGITNHIADLVYPWVVSGKLEGYSIDILCQDCVGNIDQLKADVNKLKNKLSNYEGV